MSNSEDKKAQPWDVISKSQKNWDSLTNVLFSAEHILCHLQFALYVLIYETELLTQPQKEVLILRFGLLDGRKKSGKEVAKILGISVDRARAHEVKALRKLREKMNIAQSFIQIEQELANLAN